MIHADSAGIRKGSDSWSSSAGSSPNGNRNIEYGKSGGSIPTGENVSAGPQTLRGAVVRR